MTILYKTHTFIRALDIVVNVKESVIFIALLSGEDYVKPLVSRRRDTGTSEGVRDPERREIWECLNAIARRTVPYAASWNRSGQPGFMIE